MLIAVAGTVVAALLIAGRAQRRSHSRASGAGSKTARGDRFCPLCGSALQRGERVRTVVYSGKSDTIAEVFGCKYCYGDDSQAARICPVCRESLPKDGYVIGRMFRTPEKNHLHVVGCTICRKRPADYKKQAPPKD